MKIAATVAAFICAAPVFAQNPASQRLAAAIDESRKCQTPILGIAECTYSFGGVHLTLAMNAADPSLNAFSVESKAKNRNVYLKFGGVHRCAVIESHYGKDIKGVAHAFISPRDGKVYSTWDHPACVY